MVGLMNALGQRGTAATIRTFGYRDTAHYWQLVEAVQEYQERSPPRSTMTKVGRLI